MAMGDVVMFHNVTCTTKVVNHSVPGMTRVDPSSIDLATLAMLAGTAATEHLLAEIRRAEHGAVRTSHGYVFQQLIDGTPTVGALAEALGVTQQAASKFVVELEGLGYVERRPDEHDSRIRRVALTKKGWAVVRRGRDARAKLDRALEAELGARTMREARRALVALLERTGGLEAVRSRRARPPSA